MNETPSKILDDGSMIYLGTPKWSDFSIHGSKEISENTILRVGVTNIFDTHYRTFASGISAPGRSLQVGLNIKL